MQQPIKHVIRIGLCLALVVAAAMLAAHTPGWAQSTSGTPMVSGNVVRDFARITFYWTERVGFNARTEGNRLIVQFDRPVNPDFGTILRSLYPYITSSELSGDRRTITFAMKAPYQIRTFITNTETGVDLMGIHDTETAAQTPTAEKTPPPPAPAEKKKVEKPKPAPKAKPKQIPEKPKAKTVAQAPKKPKQKQKPPTKTVQAMKVVPVESTPLAAPNLSGPELTVSLVKTEGMPTLSFPWDVRVAAAVWAQENTVNILFNKPAQIQGLAEITAESTAWLHEALQVGGKDYTLLRLTTKQPLFPIAAKEAQGYGWNISVTKNPHFPTSLLEAEFNSEAKEPYVFFAGTQVAGPYLLRDANSGQKLEVLPLFEAGKGFHPGRGFAEFALPETAQGLVVQPFSDAVRVKRLRRWCADFS